MYRDRLSPKSRRESSSNSLRKVDLQRLNIISRYYFTLYRFDPRYTLLSLNDYTEIGGERKIAGAIINNGLLHNSPLWSKGKESNPPLLLPNRYGNLTAAKINFEERIGRTMPPMHFLTRNPRSCAMFRDESYISLVSLLGYASLSIFPSMDTNYTRVMCLYGAAITRA